MVSDTIAAAVDTVGIVGTGAMGRGIAQIAAQAGLRVLLYDALPGAAHNARETITRTLQRLVEKGRITPVQLTESIDKLAIVGDLQGLASAHVIIEAVVESLEIKQKIFRQLEDIVAPTCILASNTSSLSVTAIAAACKHPQRVAGFHFFNPVPVMKIVEVIDGLLTAPATSTELMELAHRVGHQGVRAKDTPGFIVNHAGRGFVTEALRILGEGVAEIHDVDAIMREAAGFRMGPFELMDLTGLDVSQPAMESIYHQYYEEPRFRPSPLAAQRLAGGILGRKSGRGFYDYRDGVPVVAAKAIVPASLPACVWVSQAVPEWCEAVRSIVLTAGVVLETGSTPSADALVVVTPLGTDASTCCAVQRLDPRRVVAVDGLFAMRGQRSVMSTPVTLPLCRNQALTLFAHDGTPVSLVRDSAGLVAQRILACIVNIGCDIAQQRIARPVDIDHAVRLGLGYPQGPLALGDALGVPRILQILEAMQDFYGDPRYRPSPWLKRRALLGLSLLTEED
jgi:3-hydroxybutyryl-CoA dehydrogenase